MSREVRRVPAGWKHPDHESLFGGSLAAAQSEWDEGRDRGEFDNYEDYAGPRPDPADYMPDWEESEMTHFQMYETTTEGSPISPVMESPEALAQWLVDNSASAMGRITASYEGWLRVAKGGYAPTGISFNNGPVQSGVEGIQGD